MMIFCFERTSVTHTNLYGEVPEKIYNKREEVFDLRYLENSTQGELNIKNPETFVMVRTIITRVFILILCIF